MKSSRFIQINPNLFGFIYFVDIEIYEQIQINPNLFEFICFESVDFSCLSK